MADAARSIGPIDWVSDDNGNPSPQQIGAFKGLVDNMRAGAGYAIQDLEDSYTMGRGEKADGSVAFFKSVAKDFHPKRGYEVGSVQFSRNNIVATKAGAWRQGGISAYGHTSDPNHVKYSAADEL